MANMSVYNITGIGEVKLTEVHLTRNYDDVFLNLEFEVTKPEKTVPGERPTSLLVKAAKNEITDAILTLRESKTGQSTEYTLKPLELTDEMKVEVIEAAEELTLGMMAKITEGID